MRAENTNITRIIAVDPGTTVTGYGLMEEKEGRIGVLAAGVIKNPHRTDPSQRLEHIHRSLSELIDRYLPHALVMEDVFYHKNIKSVLRLGEVRGICHLAAAQKNIPVFSYAARRVKKAVVGRGAADKSQVQKMVQILLELPEPPAPTDASDALAVGITFFQDFVLKKE